MGDGMAKKKMDWKQFWYDFTHGRTHSAYGTLTVFIIAAVAEFVYASLGLRIIFFVIAVLAISVTTDIFAHLFFH